MSILVGRPKIGLVFGHFIYHFVRHFLPVFGWFRYLGMALTVNSKPQFKNLLFCLPEKRSRDAKRWLQAPSALQPRTPSTTWKKNRFGAPVGDRPKKFWAQKLAGLRHEPWWPRIEKVPCLWRTARRKLRVEIIRTMTMTVRKRARTLRDLKFLPSKLFCQIR